MTGGASLTLVRGGRDDRVRSALVLCSLLAWLAYTRLYWSLKAVHATLPPCPFLYLTGHPCPLCGGSRSFASMWEGKLAQAARFHPLGPLLFAATLVAVALLVVAVASGRTLRASVPAAWETRAYLAGGLLLAFSWTLKLAWLGN